MATLRELVGDERTESIACAAIRYSEQPRKRISPEIDSLVETALKTGYAAGAKDVIEGKV